MAVQRGRGARRRDVLRDVHMALPGLAADYSGACSALYELGGLMVVHGPHGCGGNCINRDEPRCVDLPARVFSSSLTDMDATMGRDEVLVQEAVRTWEAVGGAFVAIVGTPATMVNGTDYDAVAREIGRRCGVPVFGVDTSGTQDYTDGAAKALLAVFEMLAAGKESGGPGGAGAPRPHTVNLLGATPLDMARLGYVDAARAELAARGWETVSCWSMGSTLDDLARGLDAGVNVVLTGAGLPLARRMCARLGTPYVWGTLSGPRSADACAELLERAAAGVGEEAVLPPIPARDEGVAAGACEGPGRRALVVGDQVLAESLRRALEADAGFAQVVVASPGVGDAPLARAGDVLEACELELARFVNAGGFDVVVGDALYAALAHDPACCPCGFVPVPCVGLSGRFVRPDGVAPFGPAFLEGVARPHPAWDFWYPSGADLLQQ